jgi:hypothetical protein
MRLPPQWHRRDQATHPARPGGIPRRRSPAIPSHAGVSACYSAASRVTPYEFGAVTIEPDYRGLTGNSSPESAKRIRKDGSEQALLMFIDLSF